MGEIHRAKITSKNQITIPAGVRNALRLRPGDDVYFEVEGARAVLAAAPGALVDSVFGTGKEVYEKFGGGETYLREERERWGREG